MELYTAGTGNGQRAAIAVNECGVNCRIHVLNLGQGDQKAADYLKINPTARIPTLIDPGGPGGKPLTVPQSWAILMYLCEKTGKFLPADPAARVRVFQWMAEGAADYASVNQTIFLCLAARQFRRAPPRGRADAQDDDHRSALPSRRQAGARRRVCPFRRSRPAPRRGLDLPAQRNRRALAAPAPGDRKERMSEPAICRPLRMAGSRRADQAVDRHG